MRSHSKGLDVDDDGRQTAAHDLPDRGVTVGGALLSFGLLVLLLAVGLIAAFLSGWASILD